jgi:hypothetical protein
MIRSTFALTLLLAASCAGAAVPTIGTPSPAAKAKSTFATTFYVMHWNQPHVLDYSYDTARGELRLLVEHRGRDKTEQARLDLRLKATAPGKYPMPASGAGSFYVLGCKNTLVAGASHVQITRMDAERIEGRFHLQGHCGAMASNSETLKDGRFSLAFDKAAAK